MAPKKDQGTPAVPITASEKRRAAKLELEKFAIAGRLLIAPDGWKKEDMIFPIMENLARKAGAENPGTWDESGQAFVFPEGTDLQAVMQAVGVTVHSLGGDDQEQPAAADQDGLFSNQELDQLLQQDLTAESAELPQDPQLLPLEIVGLDPNQPRKTYSIQNLQELGDTMETVGQLQAILVRPVNIPGSPIRFLVVFGERRWRALSYKGMKYIRAEIRHLTDEQVMEIQLVENMQREDVHPMQEATYLQTYMAQLEGRTAADIAQRIGRPVRYVASRLRLNSLTVFWQNLYLKNALTLEQAMLLATASTEVQDAYAKWDPVKNYVAQWDGLAPIRLPDLKSWLSGKVRELEKAPFDINDPTLNPERGSCQTCPFNTAVGQLFLDEGAKPSCTLPSCWNVKDTNAFIRTVQDVKEQGVVFLGEKYAGDEGQVWRDIAVGAGAVGVLMEYDDFRTAWNYPEHPGPWEEFYEDQRELPEPGELWEFEAEDAETNPEAEDIERIVTQDDIEQERKKLADEYDDDLTKYNKELQEWESKSGGALMGMWINGRNRGKVVPITLNERRNASGGSKDADLDQVDAPAAVKMQIRRMEQKADRSDELDMERLWKDASNLATGFYADNKRTKPVVVFDLANDPDMAQAELGAACVVLVDKLIWDWNQETGRSIFKYLGIAVPKDNFKLEQIIMPVIAQKADQRLLNFLLRMYVVKELKATGSHKNGDTQPHAFEFIRHHAPTQLAELELQYDGKAKKRRSSLEARIEATKRQAEKTAAGPAPDPAGDEIVDAVKELVNRQPDQPADPETPEAAE